MRRLAPGLLAGTAVLALSVSTLQPAQAGPPSRTTDEGGTAAKVRQDDRKGLHAKKQLRQKRKALELLDAGKAVLNHPAGGGATVELANGEFVEFPVD